MLVRFATVCDKCNQRSEEYTAWPSCRDCICDVCPDCAYAGTEEGGDGERETVLCWDCGHALAVEIAAERDWWMERS